MSDTRNGRLGRTERLNRTPTLPSSDVGEHTRSLCVARAQIVRTLESGDTEHGSFAASRRRLTRRRDQLTTQIFELNRGLAAAYADKFTARARPHDAEDYRAAAALGLSEAIATYDPTRGAFAPWAFKTIRRRVLTAVRLCEHPTITQNDFEERPNVRAAATALTPSTVRSATASLEDVAATAGVTVALARHVLAPPTLTSLPAAVAGGDVADHRAPVDELVTHKITDSENAAAIRAAVSVLDERERYVIARRFGLHGGQPERLSDVGATLGLSRETVRLIQLRALDKLRVELGDEARPPIAPSR